LRSGWPAPQHAPLASRSTRLRPAHAPPLRPSPSSLPLARLPTGHAGPCGHDHRYGGPRGEMDESPVRLRPRPVEQSSSGRHPWHGTTAARGRRVSEQASGVRPQALVVARHTVAGISGAR
jgi:hypothetical protein